MAKRSTSTPATVASRSEVHDGVDAMRKRFPWRRTLNTPHRPLRDGSNRLILLECNG